MLRRPLPVIVFLAAVVAGLFIVSADFRSFVEAAADDLSLTVRRILGRVGDRTVVGY